MPEQVKRIIYGSLRLITDELHYNSAIYLFSAFCALHRIKVKNMDITLGCLT